MLILSQYALSGSYTVVFARGIAYQPSAALLLTVGFQTYYFMLDFIGGVGLHARSSPSSSPRFTTLVLVFMLWSFSDGL